MHVAVALDDSGRDLGGWRGPNSRAGWGDFRKWAEDLGGERQIGIEGAWSYGRGMAQYLVENGETVYEVNSRWTAMGRRTARRSEKTDSLDARAVAMFIRQEGDGLSPIARDDDTVILDLLASEREGAIAEATRLRNQTHALLLQVDPEYHLRLPALKSVAGLSALLVYEATEATPLDRERAGAVRRLAARLALALSQADELGDRIRSIAAVRFEPLTGLCGVNLLTAGTIAGILGPGQRFASDAALSAYAGVSPIEASSAGHVRHRLNRGGNRRLNAVLYRIALTQAHYSPCARAYLARRISEARRAKKRCVP